MTVYDFPAAVDALANRTRRERPRWSPTLTPALRRLRQLAEATLDRDDLLKVIDREQRHAQDTDRNWDRGAWRAEMLGTLRDVLATPAERAELDALARRVAVKVATGPAIRAAHAAAHVEDQYRGCRVYGMGRR